MPPYLKNITYERLEREGWVPLDLPSPRLPFAKGSFPTPSGKCEFYAKGLIDQGLDPLPYYQPLKTERDGLALSPDVLEYQIEAPLPQLEPRQPTAPPARRGPIVSGARVRVYNARGSVKVRAEVIDAMRPNVVTMAHGWWASRIGGSSANALTSDGLSDFGGGGDLHDTRVEVEKLA